MKNGSVKLLFLLMLLNFLVVITTCKKLEKVMMVSTEGVTNISTNSAEASGLVIDLGEGATQHGHCYAKTPDVTTANSTTQKGAPQKTGSFSSQLTDLEPGKTYYVKAYLSNGNRTVYGEEKNFSTDQVTPTIITNEATGISLTTATLNGTVNANNLSAAVSFEYGLSTSYGATVQAVPEVVTGTTSTSISAGITGLTAGTTYHFRVKAVSEAGTQYGGDILFITLCPTPSVSTSPASTVDKTSASLTGTVNANGFSAATTFDYGPTISYGNTIPAIPSPVTGSSNIMVNAALTGLTSNTVYHYRLKATNCGGTVNGSDMTFTTLASVTTNSISGVTATTAISGGNIAVGGNASILERGVCWNTTGEPTITNARTSDGPGAGSFLSNLSELAPSTIYYVRAYVINSSGASYGNEVNFKTDFICGTRLRDSRDGKSYLTVQIGDQCWFAENLNIGTRINGSEIQLDNAVIEKYCYVDNESNCNLYGGLYQWDEMMQYTTIEMAQGVCPDGWHVPSDYEWKKLEMALGMSQVLADDTGWRGSDEGGKLKAAGTTYWEAPNEGATNSSLFTALPSGNRTSNGIFDGLGFMTDFWTSTLIIDTQCWYRFLDATHSQIYRVDGYRRYGTPVRCVKN